MDKDADVDTARELSEDAERLLFGQRGRWCSGAVAGAWPWGWW